MRHRRPGFTIVELLVVVSIIALLIAILLPAIGKARDAARLTQSQGNLRNLSVACDTYAADWNDRQFTAVPDDAGLVGGNGVRYNEVIGCMGQMIAGYDIDGGIWGFYCGGGLCPQYGNGNAQSYAGAFDNVFSPHGFGSPIFGAFRLANAKAFNAYVGNGWYAKTFFAPKDVLPYRIAEPFFDYPGEFSPYPPDKRPSPENQIVAFSSYVFSPAAMWNPEVTGTCGFVNPKGGSPAAFRSPAVGVCKFPDLKTRMIEHHWLQNNESESNPLYADQWGDNSWLFSQGYNSAPVCMFFDGSVRTKGVREAMDSDQRAAKLVSENDGCANCDDDLDGPPEAGLWNRSYMTAFGHPSGSSACTSPLNEFGGYDYARAYDTFVSTGMHIGTTNGIRGRDFIAVAE